MEKNNNRGSLFDWRFKLGVCFIVLFLVLLIISLLLIFTANFNDRNNYFIGNGWAIIKNNSLNKILFDWAILDDQAISNLWFSHPYLQLNAAVIMLVFIAPVILALGLLLILRWFIKTRI